MNTLEQIKTKHLMRFANQCDTCTSVINEYTIKPFCRGLARSVYPQNECQSIADHVRKVKGLERELMQCSINELHEIQKRAWKFLRH